MPSTPVYKRINSLELPPPTIASTYSTVDASKYIKSRFIMPSIVSFFLTALVFVTITSLLHRSSSNYGDNYTCEPTQIFLNGGVDSSTQMTISYVTTRVNCSPYITYGTHKNRLVHTFTSKTAPHQYTMNTVDFGNYTSGYIRHILLSDLRPQKTYYYTAGASKIVNSFTTAPKLGTGYPLRVSVVGDLGQTSNSLLTVNNMKSTNPDLILQAGDMSYGDCDQSREEAWFNMIQGLSVYKPWYVVPGNHEISQCGDTSSFKPYDARFRMPYIRPSQIAPLPAKSNLGSPNAFVGSYDYGNSFYSVKHGPLHVLMLNSYTHSEVNSTMYKWVINELKHNVNREITPWLFVVFHCPFYNSNAAHQGEVQTVEMKKAMEGVFTEYRVNMIFSGHVHAFERVSPVLYDKLSEISPHYILIGDGGNREGHAGDYIDPTTPPIWSMFRDNTIFGHGTIDIFNKTHASFKWMKNVGGGRRLFVETDDVMVYNQVYL